MCIRDRFSTHSPYLITHLNCLLKAAHLAKNRNDLEDEINSVVPKSSWLDPDSLGAFEVKNGVIKGLKDESDGGYLVEAENIDDVSYGIDDDFDRLCEVGDSDGK